MLGHRDLQRVAECSLRTGTAIGEDALEASDEGVDQRCIESRLREIQVNQLQHCVDIALRGATRNSLAQVVDRGVHADLFAGKEFLQIDHGEFADAASGGNQIGSTGGDIGSVRKQRGSARTVGGEGDLIGIEVSRFEQNADAVRQFPLGDSNFLDLPLRNQSAASRVSVY